MILKKRFLPFSSVAKLEQVLFSTSFFLIAWLSLVLIVSNIFFVLGWKINFFTIPIAFLGCIYLMKISGKNVKEIFLSILFSIPVLALSYLFAISYYDVSWDGQGYHQEAIYLLKNGWNPVYEESNAYRVWVKHYQKGIEIIQSNIYFISNRIEAGKMINPLLMFSAFFVVLKFLRTLPLNHCFGWMLSFIIVFNPVVFTQVITYYVDANWYLTLLVSFVSLFIYFSNKEKEYLILFVLGSVAFCSIKFSSIPTFAVFSIFALGYYFFVYKRILTKPLLLIFALTILTNIHPFISNVKFGHHIFHPFYGTEKIDIINANIPKLLLNHNRVERLMISLFSKSTIYRDGAISDTVLYPFQIKKDYLFVQHDTILGGFGFLFSGVLVLSLFLFIYLMVGKMNRKNKIILLLVLGSIALSVMINPANWWARLSPQIWLLPIVIIVFGLMSQKRILKLISAIPLGLFFLNFLVIGYISFMHFQRNNTKMKDFVNSVGNKTVILDLSHQFGFQQYYLKFKEKEIKYEIRKIDNQDNVAPFTPDVYYEIK